MAKTIVVEFPLAVAGCVKRVLEKAQEEVGTYHNTEKAEDNYKKGCTFAYLECAVAMIQEAINEECVV